MGQVDEMSPEEPITDIVPLTHFETGAADFERDSPRTSFDYETHDFFELMARPEVYARPAEAETPPPGPVPELAMVVYDPRAAQEGNLTAEGTEESFGDAIDKTVDTGEDQEMVSARIAEEAPATKEGAIVDVTVGAAEASGMEVALPQTVVVTHGVIAESSRLVAERLVRQILDEVAEELIEHLADVVTTELDAPIGEGSLIEAIDVSIIAESSTLTEEVVEEATPGPNDQPEAGSMEGTAKGFVSTPVLA